MKIYFDNLNILRAFAALSVRVYHVIEIYPWKDFAGLVEMSLVFLVIMALVYRWKDFRKLYAGIIAPAPAFPASEAV